MTKYVILFFLILTNTLFAEIKKVNIIGNKRVNSATIESLVDKKISNIDTIYINNLTKKLYDTDFFADVKISFSQNALNINIVENPIVNFFYINGVKDSDLDEVNKIITLKENSIFSSSKLKKDIELTREYLNTSGYYQASIIPEVIKIDNNQINLIINIDKNEISKIKNIYFIGKKFFSDSQLIDVITSTEDSWWNFFSTSAFSEPRIEYDKQLLKEFYKSKSFYDVQIESVFASIDKNNNFNLTFSINSGKKYRFGDYDLKVLGLTLKEEDIREIKNITNKLLYNAFYSPLTINKLNIQVIDFLETKRYNNYEISIQDLKVTDDRINIIVQLNDSQKSLINKINIRGNTITEEKVIRDNLIISEGDQLNLSKVKKSVDNVKSKQLFSKVDYKIEDSDIKNFKDLNLFVKEQPTGNISAGVGYGTNGGLFEASINERNFLGQGINLNFTGRFSAEVIRGEFGYVDPNFKNSNKEVAASLFSELDDYKNSGYQNKRAGSRVATKYEIYEDIFFRPNLGVQFDNLEVTGSASNLLRSRQGDFVTTSLGYNFSYDNRDSKFNAKSGSLIYFDQNIATFISDVPTVQSGVGGTFYKELYTDKFIGSAKARLTNVTAFNNKDVKLSDRIFASSSDLRGFEQRGVGPVDSGDHIGGNNLATLSLKSTFPNPIPESLRANTFLFLDMGNIWGVDYSNAISESSKLRTTTGIALDVMSPVGPISFTYSIPLSKVSTDKEQNFLFNIGSSF
ncbi:MAG: outer membrane protein assembly factor BamA [Candidatus Fonsibacter sp.]|nr:outer membrane protein assembly factor BamA [Candidatus Fonsibacter sp.]